jgi:hypothetical protein
MMPEDEDEDEDRCVICGIPLGHGRGLDSEACPECEAGSDDDEDEP